MADWYGLLACPLCAAPLERDGGSLRCENRHAFDIARQGYVNLLPGDARAGTADTPAMVAARATFLATGHYRPVADAVAREAERVARRVPGCMVEVGAGTGEYLAAALARTDDRVGLALDISKHAARRAARAHPRIGAVVCDAWQRLPLRDRIAAVVLDVFAPRNPSESARVLVEGGALVVATPGPGHLSEIIEALGMVGVEPDKTGRLARSLAPHFDLESSTHVEAAMDLSRDEALALAAMGPSAFHTTAAELVERASRLPEKAQATLDVTVSTWRLRERATTGVGEETSA